MGGAVDHAGSCHCGDTRFVFRTDRPLAPRSCQCGFCRRHNARTVSDPHGRVRLQNGALLVAYRFAARSADYLFCGRCGIYVGALQIDGTDRLMTLNLNAFDDPHRHLIAQPVRYDDEPLEARMARRRAMWTMVDS
jgi:hypothetical protein